ncbi:MAG: BMP family lipoprotein [Candidatus Heteroscillospira sp.]|jgi:basic membrane protein A
MRKLLALVLALVMLCSLAACGGGDKTPESQAPESQAPESYEIALVTDVGNIDDKSFNEGTWKGVVEYAEANGRTYNYFRPSEDSTEARVEAIGSAVDKGANVVVCPGFMFAETLSMVQDQYPDVMFLGLDVAASDMGDKVSPNVSLITYQEEQAGYLAGYAAVKDGYTKLGFLGGMDVPAVIRYGYGFVQGADAAAAEDGIEGVEVKYWYGQTFGPSDDVKIKMDSWFTEGTEVVFACGGGIYLSAVQAAEQASGKVIGVDVDQSNQADLIITSAMKELQASTVLALTDLYDNGMAWPEDYAGVQQVLGAKVGCVGLPTAEESWRFDTFTVEQYQEVFDKIVSGDITVSDKTDEVPAVTVVTVDYQG